MPSPPVTLASLHAECPLHASFLDGLIGNCWPLCIYPPWLLGGQRSSSSVSLAPAQTCVGLGWIQDVDGREFSSKRVEV